MMTRLNAVVRLPVVMTMAGSVFASSMALGADLPHSFSSKRQLVSQVVGCMRKRMSSDKYISYNQAARDCKEQVARQNDGTAPAAPLVAADTKH